MKIRSKHSSDTLLCLLTLLVRYWSCILITDAIFGAYGVRSKAQNQTVLGHRGPASNLWSHPNTALAEQHSAPFKVANKS